MSRICFLASIGLPIIRTPITTPSTAVSRKRFAISCRTRRLPGPDVIVHADWLEQFAATEAADIKLLTYHFYAEGPPDNPASTIENLMKPNAILPGLLGRLEAVSRSSRVPYRICETNSCFGGGKPGVSDTMAAALWGLDFMFTLAQFNAAGVNMETGVNHLGFLSYYTPITADGPVPFTTACWLFRWPATVSASK